jgi:hypothetical protein
MHFSIKAIDSVSDPYKISGGKIYFMDPDFLCFGKQILS